MPRSLFFSYHNPTRGKSNSIAKMVIILEFREMVKSYKNIINVPNNVFELLRFNLMNDNKWSKSVELTI